MRIDRIDMSGARAVAATLLVILLGAACVDEKVVYEDRPPFPDPPSGAQNFVGYNNIESRQTICGSCHVTQQTLWAATRHNNAFVTLDTSSGKQEFCYACHTVSQNGSATTTPTAGWTATHDNRYRDVQCESCHGPGFPHVNGPTHTNTPLASIKADTIGPNGCGSCHSGTHHPYANEWKISRHGSTPAWGTSSSSPNNNPSCQGCHTGQGKLIAMGIDARTAYKEQNFNGGPVQITCAVCHDPHSAKIGKQLRAPIDVPDVTINLCMTCHNRRGGPDPSAGGKSNSPHAPEGPLLLGDAGWWPPGFTLPGGIDKIVGTHGTQKNPRLCAGCHVNGYSAVDPVTKQTVVSTGHRFLPIPCLDANGLPSKDQTCDVNAQSFRSCTTSGCHGSEQAARSAFVVAEQRLTTLANAVDALIKKVPPSEINANDGKYTTAEGSQFNALLARKTGTAAHNPFLAEALLTASIQQLQKDYGVQADTVLDLRNTLLLGVRRAQTAQLSAPSQR